MQLGKNISNLFKQYITPVINEINQEIKLLSKQCDEYIHCERDSEILSRDILNNPLEFNSDPDSEIQ